MTYRISSPREGLHLVQLHGRLQGSPETGVKWSINENKVSKRDLRAATFCNCREV